MLKTTKCKLLNERPRDVCLVPITWLNLPCLPVCSFHLSETKKTTPLFKQHITKAINQQNFHKVRLTGSVTCLAVYSGRLEYICWNSLYPLEFPVRICDSHYDKHETYLIYPMIAISEYTWSSDYFWYSFGLYVFQSKRKMIEPSLTAFIAFPFALVFTYTFTECVTYITKYMSSSGIIMNFGRLRDIVWNVFSS